MNPLPDNSQTIGDVIRRCSEHPNYISVWLYVWERGLFLLYQLRRKGYLHNDPNMGNFMVTPSGDIVLIDYGCASILNDNSPDNEFRNRTEEDDVINFTKMMTDVLQEHIEFTEDYQLCDYLDIISNINAGLYERRSTVHDHYVDVFRMCNNNIDQDLEKIKTTLREVAASLALDINHEISFPPKK